MIQKCIKTFNFFFLQVTVLLFCIKVNIKYLINSQMIFLPIFCSPTQEFNFQCNDEHSWGRRSGEPLK